MSPQIIFIEGNIAVGKSTILKALAAAKTTLNIQCIFEPVDTWQNLKDSNGKNLLDLFYSDMKRYAYSFQSYAFLSRARMFDTIDMNADIIFVERSVFADKEIFATNCYKQGIMTEIEWLLYNDWFTWMIPKCIPNLPSSIMYLQCPPELCKERLNTRNRTEEASVSLEYLQTIHDRHEEWLNTDPTICKAILNAKLPVDVLKGQILELVSTMVTGKQFTVKEVFDLSIASC